MTALTLSPAWVLAAAALVTAAGVLLARRERAFRRRLSAAEAAARAGDRRLRDVTDDAPGAVYRCEIAADTTYEFTFVSRRLLEMFHVSEESFAGGRDPVAGRVLAADLGPMEASIRAAVAAGPGTKWGREFRIDVPGGVRWVRGEAVVGGGRAGGVSWTGLLVDVTEQKLAAEDRRMLERAVIQSHRLESLGVMAGGVAHEFNNLLTIIQGYTMLAAEIAPPDVAEVLAPAADAARKAADLCRQMQAYSGRGNPAAAAVDLNALVTESAEFLRCAVPQHARLAFDLAVETRAVRGEAAGLRQVVLNLVANAGEAVATGGDGLVTVRTGAADGGGVWLEVADDGVGIPAEVRERIFEPFYSTKFVGRGMGLAAVHGIVVRHGGRIELAVNPGGGTVARVTLPAYSDTAETDSFDAVADDAPAAATA